MASPVEVAVVRGLLGVSMLLSRSKRAQRRDRIGSCRRPAAWNHL